MGEFLTMMMGSFREGTAESVSIGFFDLSFLIFVVSAVGYTGYLLKRSDKVWMSGFIALLIGLATMTLALGLRWYAAGIGRPPWTNLYESLVFFSWGVVVCYAVVEIKYHIKVIGAFLIPLVCMAMGLASLTGNKAITPLVPALQSLWLHFHVAGATIAYAMFIVAFGFAVLHLFRDRLNMPYFHLATAAFNLAVILAVTKLGVFLGRFELTAAAQDMAGTLVKAQIPNSDPPQFYKMAIPGMGIFMALTFVLYIVSIVVSYRARNSQEPKDLQRSFFAQLFPTLLLTLVLIRLITISGKLTDDIGHTFTLAVNNYAFALVMFAWFFAVMALVLHQVGDRLRLQLPDAKTLDNLTYKCIIVAFPILSYMLISGAIWASQSWGRFWGWDPKETAALVTWTIYLGYLHMRITKGWTGRRTAYIAVIGFVSVIFTYLGVNLVISGLHSYASA
ncbi:MAG: cytochrome c biogenesis protein CcsA [Deltaproteobacteria bacterium]|nr:cytochrome c biogenesis protein CcsA [Deltaproteobacteria bacterium]MCB9489030.1 cytochrome c biogenesis protein CcsA [Deltaproteobacteria bacterium]